MLAIKGYYRNGRVELVEPLPAGIRSAELHIVVIPDGEPGRSTLTSERFYAEAQDTENDFKQIGLASFFASEVEDQNIDWEAYFGLK